MISFDDTRLVFAGKSGKELNRAYRLFRLIQNPLIVKLGKFLLAVALRLGLPVGWALRPTFFNHFCGGESIRECDKTIEKLGKNGIKTILDYAAEGKENETAFEHTAAEIIKTIEYGATHPMIPFAVFKPSGIARSELLKKVTAGSVLTVKEVDEYNRVLDRVDRICRVALKAHVPVMIDAEESWVQEAVDRFTEKMMQKYNKHKVIVYHTLQMYRHDRLDYLKKLDKDAKTHEYYLGFKLVRGAYMGKERKRATVMGYPSPIYPDKTATDKAYNTAVEYCIDNLERIAVCAGTHNELSSEFMAELLVARGYQKNHLHAWFAQLLGMSDHISYTLALSGYNVVKYVPYGQIKTVIPYLIRRAEENTSIAGQVGRELLLIRKEKLRRKSYKI